MKEPVWIPRDVALAIQEKLLVRFGGLGGIRDEGLIDSALARPQQILANGEPTLFDLAVAYASGIIRNHPFLDGNKRAGFMVAYTFLGINGFEVTAPEEAVLGQTLALAAREITEADYARWLKASCTRSVRKV
ncbi:MAG: death-on-curing protein [Lentisphaerae bacterium RIFOXYC12_FULL_60_16]|nr:MAG: death-on-curing protein [Lentisphaerae bacterium RIFOXYC12_FULL_60_16]OGV84197.1 MAG: death-on-curing protein [Lentisphaerae bacterium RIFOXYB12_FULL_60_10]